MDESPRKCRLGSSDVLAMKPFHSSRCFPVKRKWCQRRDLNPRPKAYESSALPLSYSGNRKGAQTLPQAPAMVQVLADRRAVHGEAKPATSERAQAAKELMKQIGTKRTTAYDLKAFRPPAQVFRTVFYRGLVWICTRTVRRR
jgi:hypothetical protein